MKNDILKHLARDPKLATIIQKVEIPDVDAHSDIYLNLLDSIVSQQLSVKAAGTIFQRFLDIFDDLNPTPHRILELDVEVLRGCGLSYQKAGYIQNIAAYWIDNQCIKKDWMAVSDEEIIAELTTIKGVGKWTVQMILMFRLDRPDVFPIDDLVIRQGMMKLYGVEAKGKELVTQLTNIAEAWRPYRTMACRYIWRYKDVAGTL
jgi:DNA-3-methyladenine glycosylase II